MEKEEEKKLVKLDERLIAEEDLQKYRETLPSNQRIVEVTTGEFKTVTRMQG